MISNVTNNQSKEELRLGVEKQKAAVAAHQAEVRNLEMDYDRTPAILQMLGKMFVFGPAKELEWAHFKLNLTQKELELITAHSAHFTEETVREKMARMIKENPPELTQHIVAVYQPLIEAEESIEKKY
jgi:hypothetical protein